MGLLVVFVVLLQWALVLSECPSEWSELINSGGKCIKAYNLPMGYISALEYCQKIDGTSQGTLVSIHSAFQNAQVASVGQKCNQGCLYWIGLYDFDDQQGYVWTDNSEFDYKFWSDGYPSSPTEGTAVFMDLAERNRWLTTEEVSNQNCFVCVQTFGEAPTNPPTLPIQTTPKPASQTTAGPVVTTAKTTAAAVTTSTQKVTTQNPTTKPAATTPRPTVSQGPLPTKCQDGWLQFQSACYIFESEERKTFDDAEYDCQTKGGHLASIHSSDENLFLFNQEPYYTSFRLGLRRADANSDWTWSDGTATDYLHWFSNAPWEGDGYDCGLLDGGDDGGFWMNMGCNIENFYICKQQLRT